MLTRRDVIKSAAALPVLVPAIASAASEGPVTGPVGSLWNLIASNVTDVKPFWETNVPGFVYIYYDPAQRVVRARVLRPEEVLKC